MEHIMDIKATEYVVFDVETTGLSPIDGDRIIEIAAIKVKNGKMGDTLESFINPERALSPEAQKINHITQDMVQDAPTSKEFLPTMIDFIGGACVVGHNVGFDLKFLCYELSLAGRRLKDETPAVDTLKLSRELIPHLTSHRLSNVAQYLGITIKETHRALVDVELTVGVLNHLLELAWDQKIKTFAQLYQRFSVTKPSFKIEEVTQGFLF